MIRRAVVDDFVGIVFAIRAAHLLVGTRSESSRVAKAHKLPLRRAGGEEECGEKRQQALVREGMFHFILEPMDSKLAQASR